MPSQVSLAHDAPSARTKNSKPSPKQDDGAVCVQWVRCGRSWCRCMHGGARHGPYYARYWWHDGRRRKAYVRQKEAITVSALCDERRAAERQEHKQAEAAHQAWREVRALIAEIEHDKH